MMDMTEEIENFYGVYLLFNINPKYKGRTYIGYTRDPQRRVKQHNRGVWSGGAYRTNNKGPWKMVLIVHGFPNNISALRFEWAWQNPEKTTRLRNVENIKKMPRKESQFQYCLRILSEMLKVGPWNRLPLNVRWLESEYIQEFKEPNIPPKHMKICQGPVKSKNIKSKKNENESNEEYVCNVCNKISSPHQVLHCYNSICEFHSHLSCLADMFLDPGEYVPIGGTCPKCDKYLLWGDLIQKLKAGTYNHMNKSNDSINSDSDDISLCADDTD